MPSPTTTAPSNETPNSQVDAKLKPTAELHILVGGPYTMNGELHRYGHTAIRIKTSKSDLTYDFGRYGATTGNFGESGEGILRVWESFDAYIATENRYKRVTTDFTYIIFDHQAAAATSFWDEQIKAGKLVSKSLRGNKTFTVYKLKQEYTALQNNCTTISMESARRAMPRIEHNSHSFIKPDDVMTMSERLAMRAVGGGQPTRLFLPANLQKYLMSNTGVKVNSVTSYGSTK